jgi:hypothetical protein
VRPGRIEELQWEDVDDPWDQAYQTGQAPSEDQDSGIETVTVKFKWGIEELTWIGSYEITVLEVQENEWFAREETVEWSADGKSFAVDISIAEILEEKLSGTIWIGGTGRETTRNEAIETKNVEIWSPPPKEELKAMESEVVTIGETEGDLTNARDATMEPEETMSEIVTIEETEDNLMSAQDVTTETEETKSEVATVEETKGILTSAQDATTKPEEPMKKFLAIRDKVEAREIWTEAERRLGLDKTEFFLTFGGTKRLNRGGAARQEYNSSIYTSEDLEGTEE